MNLSELVSGVIEITSRPDLEPLTNSAVKAATLKGHQSDYYYKDLYEVGVEFSSAAFLQSLDYRALLPRWRALKYLRKYEVDINSGQTYPGALLEVIPPENILDSYKVQRPNICYVAGAYVQINSSTEEDQYLLGAYLNPDISTDGYDSWIALDHPFYIIYGAAAQVFKAIGKDDEATIYRTEQSEQLAILKISNILPNGF